jgi:hypothetical protein
VNVSGKDTGVAHKRLRFMIETCMSQLKTDKLKRLAWSHKTFKQQIANAM